MISARAFALYRLAVPAGKAAAAEAATSKTVLERTLRRVVVSRSKVTAGANSNPFGLSRVRYCATSADKGQTIDAAKKSVDAEQAVVAAESVAGAETIPGAETLCAAETVADAETATAAEAVATVETVTAAETVATDELVAADETFAAAETVVAAETVAVDESVGDETVAVDDSIAAAAHEDPATSDPEYVADLPSAAVLSVDSIPPPTSTLQESLNEDTSPPAVDADSAPPLCDETVAQVESADDASPPPVSDDSAAGTTLPPPLPPSTTPIAAAAGLHVHVITDRALIRVEGSDTQSLLQGLVTQDLELLSQTTSVYAMMLNLQGRVLYDVIIYNVSSKRSEIQKYLLECDASVAPDIVSHLKKYKLRKNCDIVDVSDVYEVSAVLPTTERMAGLSSLPRKSEFAEAFDPIVIACRDPRLKDIGWRLICGKGIDVSESLGGGAVTRPLDEYREQRYKLGVAEGIRDLEPGKSFPLESNLVFLNGVSFSKGCYLGQELTARTHHTGVIRKRIMPLMLSTSISPDFGPSQSDLILNTGGKDAGKFLDGVGTRGIGLVRVNMSGGRLIIVGKGRESECYARMPHWWPVDDPAAVLGEEEEESVEETGEKSAQTSI